MGETLEQRKRRLYTAMSHEELVEEMMKRDDKEDKNTMYFTAKNNISDEIVKALQKTLLRKIEDPQIIDDLVLHKTTWGTTEPSDVLKRIFEKAITDDVINEFREGLTNTLKEKYKEICEKVMLQVFLNGIIKDNNFLYNAINSVIETNSY